MISNASAQSIPGGFGDNLSMQDTVSIIVPVNWKIRATRSVLAKKVSWTGDQHWQQVLKTIAKKNNFLIATDHNKRVITLTNKKMVYGVVPTKVVPKVKATISSPQKENTVPEKTSPQPKQSTTQKINNVKDTKGWSLSNAVTELFVSKRKTNLNLIEELTTNVMIDLGFNPEGMNVDRDLNRKDNIVKFSIDFYQNGKRVNTFILFDGESVYSPLIGEEKHVILLNWYSQNFTHPTKTIPKPIVIEKPPTISLTPKIYNTPTLKDEKSYAIKREFVAQSGKMLSEVLSNWSESIGVQLVWDTEIDFKITRTIRFYNNYLLSVDNIIKFYNKTMSPLQTRFFLKNKTLLVGDLKLIYKVSE
jgi:hypothetical protein